VDDDDYEWLSQWKWCALVRKATKNVYAKRVEHRDGRPVTVYMHRVIAGAGSGESVDHIDRNTLNNQRANLRIVTHQENMMNLKVQRNNKTGFRGVSWDKSRQKWAASISHRKVKKNLGRYDTPEDAARAYDLAAVTLRGH